MFITEDAFIFTQTFLTGNKQKINNFIMKDESLSQSPPSLLLDENLNLKCAKKVVDQFIQNREVYLLDTWALVCGGKRIMIPQYWKLGVDDINMRRLFHHIFVWPFNPKSMIRTVIDHICELVLEDSISGREDIIGRIMFVRCPDVTLTAPQKVLVDFPNILEKISTLQNFNSPHWDQFLTNLI
ncbi:hypothetical protein TCON_2669 [Astathelohania contejeani]|uniref:Uncharacterized protein n=1 Tax=Astathelohania contejeani TaxID=164912 RepID=A0ABQ7HVC9_9MICR|nr:hypothetical protein TCON_2669 [Thelohania contejeani]